MKPQSQVFLVQNTEQCYKGSSKSKSVTAIDPSTKRNNAAPVVSLIDVESDAEPSSILSQVAVSPSKKSSHIASIRLHNQAEGHIYSEPSELHSQKNDHLSSKGNRTSPPKMHYEAVSRMQSQVADNLSAKSDKSSVVSSSWMKGRVEKMLNTKSYLVASSSKQSQSDDQLSTNSSHVALWMKNRADNMSNIKNSHEISSKKPLYLANTKSSSLHTSGVKGEAESRSDARSRPIESKKYQCQPDDGLSTESNHLRTSWVKSRAENMSNAKSCKVSSSKEQCQPGDHKKKESSHLHTSWMKRRTESMMNTKTCHGELLKMPSQLSIDSSCSHSSRMKSQTDDVLSNCFTPSYTQCKAVGQLNTSSHTVLSMMPSQADAQQSSKSSHIVASKMRSQADVQQSVKSHHIAPSMMETQADSHLNTKWSNVEPSRVQSSSDGQQCIQSSHLAPSKVWSAVGSELGTSSSYDKHSRLQCGADSTKTNHLVSLSEQSETRLQREGFGTLPSQSKTVQNKVVTDEGQNMDQHSHISFGEKNKHRSKRPTRASQLRRSLELSQPPERLSWSKYHQDCSHPHTETNGIASIKHKEKRNSNEGLASRGRASSIFSITDQVQDNHVVLNHCQILKAPSDKYNAHDYPDNRSIHKFGSTKPSRAKQRSKNSEPSHLTAKQEDHGDHDHLSPKGRTSSASPNFRGEKKKRAQLRKASSDSSVLSEWGRGETGGFSDSDIQSMHVKNSAWDHYASSPSLSVHSGSKTTSDYEYEDDTDFSYPDSEVDQKSVELSDSQSNQYISAKPSTSEVRKYYENLRSLISDSQASLYSSNSKAYSESAEYSPKHLAAIKLMESIEQSRLRQPSSFKYDSHFSMPSNSRGRTLKGLVRRKSNRRDDSARSQQDESINTSTKVRYIQANPQRKSPPSRLSHESSSQRGSYQYHGLEIKGITCYKPSSKEYNDKAETSTTAYNQLTSAQKNMKRKEEQMEDRGLHKNHRKRVKAKNINRIDLDSNLRNGERPGEDTDQMVLDHPQVKQVHERAKSRGGAGNKTVEEVKYGESLVDKINDGSRSSGTEKTQRLPENIQQSGDMKYLRKGPSTIAKTGKEDTSNKTVDGQVLGQGRDKQLKKEQIQNTFPSNIGISDDGFIRKNSVNHASYATRKESFGAKRASLGTTLNSSIKRETTRDGKVRQSVVLKKKRRNVQWGGRQSWFVEPLGRLSVYN